MRARGESLSEFARDPWSVLQTQWLDLPIGKAASDASPTWEAFSDAFEVCLQGVSLHVTRFVDDRASVESLVTVVFVDNLDVLVSQLGIRDKLDRLRTAADRLLESQGFIRDEDTADTCARGVPIALDGESQE